MCGLNGIFAYHDAASLPTQRELLSTRDAMRARGPDGFGEWWSQDQRCALAHRRLSIIDLSDRAAQPMVSEDKQAVLVFNGEIYNYPDLRKSLEAQGVRFRTTSDSEVLLHLYKREGDAMVHKLRGMYAFVIWDAQKLGLFLARDPYGIKPLYVANDGWTFRFASQVKALLAGKHVSRDPDSAGLVGFHLFGSVPEPFTLYREIRSIPAGHTMWVDAAGPREPKAFAQLGGILASAPRIDVATSELHAIVRASVSDSVKAHLLADVEVGLFLSAGVDSGALLGLMKDAGQSNVRAITLAFDEFQGTPEDEAPFAARVAKHYGAQHVVRCVGEKEFENDLPAILEAMDQPSIDGVNTWFVAKAAREAGLKVALSGLGGDELLAGYPSFRDIPRWRRLYGPLAAVPGLGSLARKTLRTLAPEFASSLPKALGLLEYADTWPGCYLLRRGLYLPHELADILGSAVASEGLRRLDPFRRLGDALSPDPGSEVARVCALESGVYMRHQLLRDADWAGMAHNLEIRVPLVDFDLLKALAPVIHRLKPGAGKVALAMSPSTPLPDEIIHRAKTGFGVPTGAWTGKLGTEAHGTIQPCISKGLASRRWSQTVISRLLTGASGKPLAA